MATLEPLNVVVNPTDTAPDSLRVITNHEVQNEKEKEFAPHRINIPNRGNSGPLQEITEELVEDS